MTEWISCDENMPAPKVQVIAWYTPVGRVTPCAQTALRGKVFEDEDLMCWWNSRGEVMNGKVTHWMPFPEPPK